MQSHRVHTVCTNVYCIVAQAYPIQVYIVLMFIRTCVSMYVRMYITHVHIQKHVHIVSLYVQYMQVRNDTATHGMLLYHAYKVGNPGTTAKSRFEPVCCPFMLFGQCSDTAMRSIVLQTTSSLYVTLWCHLMTISLFFHSHTFQSPEREDMKEQKVLLSC